MCLVNGPCVSIHGGCHSQIFFKLYPWVPFWDFPHLMSPNDDEWRVDIFSNPSSCPKFVNRTFTGWQMTLKRSTKINFFLISPSGGNVEDENIFPEIFVHFKHCHFHVKSIIVASPIRQCPGNKSQNQRNLKKPPASDCVVSSSANLFPAHFLVRAT